MDTRLYHIFDYTLVPPPTVAFPIKLNLSYRGYFKFDMFCIRRICVTRKLVRPIRKR